MSIIYDEYTNPLIFIASMLFSIKIYESNIFLLLNNFYINYISPSIPSTVICFGYNTRLWNYWKQIHFKMQIAWIYKFVFNVCSTQNCQYIQNYQNIKINLFLIFSLTISRTKDRKQHANDGIFFISDDFIVEGTHQLWSF